MTFADVLSTFRATSAQRKRQIVMCWLWFFLVLFSYYIIKPLRDAMATPLADRLGDVYAGTFVGTLIVLPVYSHLVSRLSRLHVVHLVYHASAACLVAFSFLLADFGNRFEDPRWLAAVFMIWVSVFNLLAATVFWSVMADVFSSAEGELWFGSMAAGGSLGSLAGSITARYLSESFPTSWLLIVAAITCELVVVTAWMVLRMNRHASVTPASVADPTPLLVASQPSSNNHGTDGSIWAGVTSVLQSRYLLAICLFVALGKFGATFIYNNLQLVLEAQMPDVQDRTILFARMNIWTQSGSLLLQAIGASLLMQFLGVGAALVVPCVAVVGMLIWMSWQATLPVLVVSQVAQQILGYGLLVPAQNVLFTVVSREEKYKSKAFVDMVVFRGSDVAAGQTCQWMIRTGTALTALALWILPVAVLWTFIAFYLGAAYQRRQEAGLNGDGARVMG